ncbi:MAG: LysR family transcriptional regulator [Clostridiaceae bacterium]|nr:LysR family transcriptional regulator [Clostridiaceae bacterium]
MQINKLCYFISVAKYLNFTKAAEECHLAQSAMSQQINSLESELGFKLFKRTSRNVILTESGKVFYKNIKNVINDYNSAVRKAESAAYGYKGVLTIGICGSNEQIVLPKKLKEFKKDYPFIEIRFKKANYNEIPKELEDGIYDIVFTWPYDFKDLKDIDYKITFREGVAAMVSFENHLSKKNVVTRDELSKENNLVIANNKNSNTYKHFCSFYTEEQLKNALIETVSDDSILRLKLELNMGISIVPKSLKHILGKDFAFLEIEGQSHIMEFCAAYMKVNSNPCIDIFLKSFDL